MVLLLLLLDDKIHIVFMHPGMLPWVHASWDFQVPPGNIRQYNCQKYIVKSDNNIM